MGIYMLDPTTPTYRKYEVRSSRVGKWRVRWAWR